MPIPLFLALGFILLTLALWAVLARVLRAHGLASFAYVLLAWIVVTGALSAAGVLARWDRVPPPLMPVVVLALAGIVYTVFGSPWRDRLIAIPQSWLIGIQVFRLPTELLLSGLAARALLPVEMTFHGRNFDILTGVLALPVAGWAHRASSRAMLWIYNLGGLVLLIWIAGMGILSTPTPFRLLTLSMHNAYIGHFPIAWLPAFLVPMALLLHLVSLRKLAKG